MCLRTIRWWYTGPQFTLTLLSTTRPRDITPRAWQFPLALAWPWGQCGAAVGVGVPAGAAITSRSTTTTTSTVTPTLTATSMRTAVVLGSTIRNIVAVPPIGTERLRTGLGVRHAENLWPADRLVLANKVAILVIGRRAEPPPVRGLPQAGPAPEAGISRAVVAAARTHSAGEPEDSMDPALGQLVAAVPPAWDREVAASVAAAGGGGKSPRLCEQIISQDMKT